MSTNQPDYAQAFQLADPAQGDRMQDPLFVPVSAPALETIRLCLFGPVDERMTRNYLADKLFTLALADQVAREMLLYLDQRVTPGADWQTFVFGTQVAPTIGNLQVSAADGRQTTGLNYVQYQIDVSPTSSGYALTATLPAQKKVFYYTAPAGASNAIYLAELGVNLFMPGQPAGSVSWTSTAVQPIVTGPPVIRATCVTTCRPARSVVDMDRALALAGVYDANYAELGQTDPLASVTQMVRSQLLTRRVLGAALLCVLVGKQVGP